MKTLPAKALKAIVILTASVTLLAACGCASGPLVDLGGAQAGVIESADLQDIERRLDSMEKRLESVERRIQRIEKGY